MTIVLTDKRCDAPADTVPCSECGGVAKWIGTNENGDGFLVPGYEDDKDDYVMFDIYRCQGCYAVAPNAASPIWMDDMGSFYAVEVTP